jgi:sister chromatid cohesion protein DCC1
VNLSNTLLVVTPPPDTALDFADDAVVIRDQVNEILELAPAVPKISKLVALLRGREYDESNEDDDEEDTDVRFVSFPRIRRVFDSGCDIGLCAIHVHTSSTGHPS